MSCVLGCGGSVSAVIWTTTPWTLPFNEAICYSNSLRYAQEIVTKQSTMVLYLIRHCGKPDIPHTIVCQIL